jgi:hypothetical protein
MSESPSDPQTAARRDHQGYQPDRHVLRTDDERVALAAMYVPHQDAHDSRSSCYTAAERVCGRMTPDMPPGYPPVDRRKAGKRGTKKKQWIHLSY